MDGYAVPNPEVAAALDAARLAYEAAIAAASAVNYGGSAVPYYAPQAAYPPSVPLHPSQYDPYAIYQHPAHFTSQPHYPDPYTSSHASYHYPPPHQPHPAYPASHHHHPSSDPQRRDGRYAHQKSYQEQAQGRWYHPDLDSEAEVLKQAQARASFTGAPVPTSLERRRGQHARAIEEAGRRGGGREAHCDGHDHGHGESGSPELGGRVSGGLAPDGSIGIAPGHSRWGGISGHGGAGAMTEETTSTLLRHPAFHTRYFVLKAVEVEDIERAMQTKRWTTQRHNDRVLDQAFRCSESVILVFGANHAGQFAGAARMASSPYKRVQEEANEESESEQKAIEELPDVPLAPREGAHSVVTPPKASSPTSSAFSQRDARQTGVFTHDRLTSEQIADLGRYHLPTDAAHAVSGPATTDPEHGSAPPRPRMTNSISTRDFAKSSSATSPPSLARDAGYHFSSSATLPDARSTVRGIPMGSTARGGVQTDGGGASRRRFAAAHHPGGAVTIASNPEDGMDVQAMDQWMLQAKIQNLTLDEIEAQQERQKLRALLEERYGSSSSEAGEATSSSPMHKAFSETTEDETRRGSRAATIATVTPATSARGDPEEGEEEEEEDRSFAIDWIIKRPIPFHTIRNLRNPWREDRQIKVSRDGTELDPAVGVELLEIWLKQPADGCKNCGRAKPRVLENED